MILYDSRNNKIRSDAVDTAHVLVIGSGGAGVRAAIEAAGYGETLLVSKTLTGKGGCTTMAEGGYNAVLREADSCEIHFEDTLKGGAYLNNRDLVQILVEEAPQRIQDLLAWGAVFDVTDCCEVAQRPFGGQRFPRTCDAGDGTGHEMMATLIDRLHNTGVRVENEVTIISLQLTGKEVYKNDSGKKMPGYFRRLIIKNKDFILEQVLAVKGLMQLLMKQRNTNQKWTEDEVREIKKHLRNISRVVPALLIFLLPGGSLLLPFLAERLDRRKSGRPLNEKAGKERN